jgi:FkbM family methyltransferase
MRIVSKAAVSTIVAVLLVVVAMASGFVGATLWARYQFNASCCQMRLSQSLIVSAKEILGLATFYSQMGQDRWVSEKVFPGVKNGFFLDVGSGDGTFMSNTKALEQKGWTGICVDPFPKNMQDRSCQIFKEAVFSKAGERVQFWAAEEWGGIIDDTFGISKDKMQKYKDLKAGTVEFTTVTLADILERAKAPRFIHYVSMDIEGGELHALQGFPFDKYQIGALSVEHNFKEPKRSEIKALMESHGYKHVHTSDRDDFYVPATEHGNSNF